MFTFEDKGERSLTLRPEGTAPICRAYLEHGMHKLAQPVKLSYVGPFFRHERPQAGRYRQFHQIGLECIGTDSPLADAEAIMLLSDLLGELGVPGVELRLGSLGSLRVAPRLPGGAEGAPARARGRPLARRARADRRQPAARLRLRRRGDPGRDGERADDRRRPRGRGRRALRRGAGAARRGRHRLRVDPTLVRGLDYYTRTIFSFVCDALGAQSEIGGGGRYDGLIEQLGGPATPAVGWAAGIERILLALDEEDRRGRARRLRRDRRPRRSAQRAMALAIELRHAGLSAEVDLAGRGLKGQLKHADRIGARRVLILEADGSAQLRDMASGEQRARRYRPTLSTR